MMWLQKMAVMIALWPALICCAVAQPSQPSNVLKPPSAQQQPSDEHHDSKPAPLAKTANPENTQSKPDFGGSEKPKQRNDAWLLSDKIAAIAIAVGFLQFVVLLATVSVMMRTAKRQLRAYIAGPTKAEISDFNTPNPVNHLEFKNSGQTPAHNVRFWTSSAVAAYPLAEPPTAPTGDFSEREGSSVGTIGPGGTFYSDSEPNIAVTDAERTAVLEGSAAFFVYGELFYRDAFGYDRHTTFCHYYRRPQRSAGPLATYHKWNKAT